MEFLVPGEHSRAQVRSYVLDSLRACWEDHGSAGLCWEDEPGYVQWAGWSQGVQLECSSEQYLGRAWTQAERDRLQELGFAPPGPNSPNHWQRVVRAEDLPAAADALVACLYELLLPQAGHAEAVRPAGSVVVLAPVGKHPSLTVAHLAQATAEAMGDLGPVAVVDVSSSRGLGLWRWLDAEPLDDPWLPSPSDRGDVHLLAGWSGGDHDPHVLQDLVASVKASVARLRDLGWHVLVVGPLLFEHRLWAYEDVVVTLADRLLLLDRPAAREDEGAPGAELVRRVRATGRADVLVVALRRGSGADRPVPALAGVREAPVPEESLEHGLTGLPWLPPFLRGEAPGPGVIDVPAVLLRISKRWHAGMDEDEVYDAVRGWWVVGPKRERAEYAFAVAKGRVRGVFRVDGWRPRKKEGDPVVRWGFDGEPADELAWWVGQDVSSYFPPGAANPVRYVNCDEAVPVRPSQVDHPEPLTSTTSAGLSSVCAGLLHDPLLRASLGHQELFHSNLLAWLLESHPACAERLLAPWLTPQPEQALFRVRREHRHLDLVVELPGRAPVAVENKVFSLPDEGQLDAYAAQNAAGFSDPSLLLLSLNDPGWADGRHGPWRWVSYGVLAARVRAALAELPHPDPFAHELVERWCRLVLALEQVVRLTEPEDPDEPLLLDGDAVEVLGTVGLADSVQKARTRRVRHLLERRFADRGLQADEVESSFTRSMPLLSVKVRLPGGGRVGWQLQGVQYRRFVMLPKDLAGSKEANAAYAAQHHAAWFDFREEQAAFGPFVPAPTASYKHFAPDFVYDYVKAPGLTVGEVLGLGELTLRAALRHRDGG